MPGRTLDRIEIAGYKSIALCELDLRPLNVLVGPNGAGKSNFVSALGLLGSIMNQTLQLTVARAGGASTLLHGGPKVTEHLSVHVYFGSNQYEVSLVPGAADDLIFEREICYFQGPRHDRPYNVFVGSGYRESNISQVAQTEQIAEYCLEAMTSWKVFHFHDTSPQAGAKQKQQVGDNHALRPDASNLAPFLFALRESHPDHYRRIVDSIRLVAPFFQDFKLAPDRINPEVIRLEWRQVGSDSYFSGHALSDGTLRFICLSVLLLQPEPPSVIVIDEPELGLHPFAITQLADMFRAVSLQRQLIVSTQSVTLLNQVDAEDVVVAEQREGSSRFERLDLDSLQQWLSEYSVGELWEKNLIGGRPY